MYQSRIFLKAIVLGIVMGYNSISFAQDGDEFKAKKNSFKISPTAFFASTFAISYERHVGESVTLQLTGGIMAASKNTSSNSSAYVNSNNKDQAQGGLVDLGLKYYFLKGQSVMSGLYAGPYGRYSKNNFDIYTTTTTGIVGPVQYKYSITSYEFGALFGWQWVVKNAFVMDMFVGGGMKVSDSTAPTGYDRENRPFWILEGQDYTGIIPKGGLRVGFVF